MTPLLTEILGALVRWALTGIGGWLLAQGLLTHDQYDKLIAGATAILVTLVWAIWVRYRDRLLLNTALKSPSVTTEVELHNQVHSMNSATRRTVAMRKAVILVICATAAGSMACAKRPPTITTEAGKIAYNADQIAMRIGELQNAAIAAETSGALERNLTRQIVTFTVAANKTLRETPNGWYASVAQGWQSLNAALPDNVKRNPALITAWATVETIIAVFAPRSGGQEVDHESRTIGRVDPEPARARDYALHSRAPQRDGRRSDRRGDHRAVAAAHQHVYRAGRSVAA